MHRVGIRSILIALAGFFIAASAHASNITINDDIGGFIGLTVIFTPDTTLGTVSANCSVVSLNQWNCAEGAPLVLQADLVRSGNSLANSNLNIWDDHPGGIISDTLAFAFTNVTSTTAHATITFQSGPGVVAIAPAGNTFDVIEGPPLVVNLNGGRDGGLLVVNTSPIPEPASMLLLGTGLVGVGARRWRNRRQRG